MKLTTQWLALVPLVFLLLFFFYPLASILMSSLAPGGHIDLSGFADLASDPYYAQVLWFTTWQAALSTLLTLAAALPGAYIFARYRFPGKGFWRALTTIPFLMPTVVVAAAFSALLGPRGWLNVLLQAVFNLDAPPLHILNTVAAILIAHVFYNYTIIFRMVSGFWANLDPRLEDAARVLGANSIRVWAQITIPLIAPAILASVLLVFIFDFTSFGIVLILGGPRLATLEVEIYRQTVNIFNLPLASALSLVQMLVTFSIMVIYARLQSRVSRPLRLVPTAVVQKPPESMQERVGVSLVLIMMFLLLVLPLLTLVYDSLDTETGLGFQNYANLGQNPRGSVTFVPPIDAVRNSLAFGAIVVALSLLLGVSAAYSLVSRRNADRSILDAVYMLPLGISGVTLGFGYIIALDKPPLDLRASVILVPLAHTLLAFPFMVRALLPVLRGIKPNLREAAQILGASPFRVWLNIDVPIVARALVVGAVFALVISLGEFGATSLIALPEYPTVPIAIYRLMGQPGIANFGQAIALGVILMVTSASAIMIMERARLGDIGEF